MERKAPEIYTTKKGNKFVLEKEYCEVDIKGKAYKVLFTPLKSYEEDSDEGMVVIEAPLHEMEVISEYGESFCYYTGYSQRERIEIVQAGDDAYDLEQGIEWATLDAIDELIKNY